MSNLTVKQARRKGATFTDLFNLGHKFRDSFKQNPNYRPSEFEEYLQSETHWRPCEDNTAFWYHTQGVHHESR